MNFLAGFLGLGRPTALAFLPSRLQLLEVFRPALGDLLPTLPSKTDGGGIFLFCQNSEAETVPRNRIMHDKRTRPKDAAEIAYDRRLRKMERNSSIPEDVEVKQERTAHHEAGHVVVAADQGLKLRPEGLMVDPAGWGLGCYHKEPDGSDLSRTRILLATFAGFYAEKCFCEQRSYAISVPDIWFRDNNDGREARILLDEMSIGSLSRGSVPATFLNLQDKSMQRVEMRWNAIKELATALLAKSWEPRKPLKSGGSWSHENETTAKYLLGQEVIGILAQHGIAAACDPDC